MATERPTIPPISRRQFARRAVLASAVASVAPAAALSTEFALPPEQAQPAANYPTPPAGRPQVPPNMSKLSPESQAEVEARFQSILAQYGTRFSDDQRADLRRLSIVVQAPLERLRAYKVENGDGPGLYLKPLFEREKKPKPPAASQTGPSRSSNPKSTSPALGTAKP